MPPVGDHSNTATYALAPKMGTTIVFSVNSRRTAQYQATKSGYLFTTILRAYYRVSQVSRVAGWMSLGTNRQYERYERTHTETINTGRVPWGRSMP